MVLVPYQEVSIIGVRLKVSNLELIFGHLQRMIHITPIYFAFGVQEMHLLAPQLHRGLTIVITILVGSFMPWGQFAVLRMIDVAIEITDDILQLLRELKGN